MGNTVPPRWKWCGQAIDGKAPSARNVTISSGQALTDWGDNARDAKRARQPLDLANGIPPTISSTAGGGASAEHVTQAVATA